jgi:hypothetical protein
MGGGTMIRAMLAVLCCLALMACSSTFKTARFDLVKWQPIGEPVEGLVYYEPHQVVVTYEFTALTDKGNLIGTAEEGACARIIQKQDLVIEPNFGNPQVILNLPSPFSNNKLTVNLSNGMITSVNTESTLRVPELVKEVTGLAKEAAIIPLVKLPSKLPACNAAPVIAKKVPYAWN